MNYSNLTSIFIQDIVKPWLLEDIPNYDIGGYVVGDKINEAHIFFKSNGVFSGLPYAEGRLIILFIYCLMLIFNLKIFNSYLSNSWSFN